MYNSSIYCMCDHGSWPVMQVCFRVVTTLMPLMIIPIQDHEISEVHTRCMSEKITDQVEEMKEWNL